MTSPLISFYLSTVAFLIGSFVCLFLKDIEKFNLQTNKSIQKSKLRKKEKLIIIFGLFVSIIFAYVNIAIHLFVIEIGGSFKELGFATASSTIGIVIITIISPYIKKIFSYKVIMIADYFLIILSIFLMFHFKSFLVIYICYGLLMGISSLENMLWSTSIERISKNYKKSIGLLKGIKDYLSGVLCLVFGFSIQKFGSYNVALFIMLIAFTCINIITFSKKFRFFRHAKTIKIKNSSLHTKILPKFNA